LAMIARVGWDRAEAREWIWVREERA
jgi:hypothetical protein